MVKRATRMLEHAGSSHTTGTKVVEKTKNAKKKMQKETAAQMLLIHIGQALATSVSWPLAAARHFRWQYCLIVSNQIRCV